MSDIKMSELLNLPVDCHDLEFELGSISAVNVQRVCDKINAYDKNQERIKELEEAVSRMNYKNEINTQAVRDCYKMVNKNE